MFNPFTDLVDSFKDLWAEAQKPPTPRTDFETKLRKITASEAEREDARQGALEMVMLGLTSDQLHKMAQTYYRVEALGLTRSDLISAARSKLTPADMAKVEEFRDTLR